MSLNGEGRFQDLKEEVGELKEEIKTLHSRITSLTQRFEHLVGQLTMLKWLIGGGFALFIYTQYIGA